MGDVLTEPSDDERESQNVEHRHCGIVAPPPVVRSYLKVTCGASRCHRYASRFLLLAYREELEQPNREQRDGEVGVHGGSEEAVRHLADAARHRLAHRPEQVVEDLAGDAALDRSLW